MIAELGHYALVLALGLALVQACVPIIGVRKHDPVRMAVAGPTAIAQFCFVAIAFGALIICYVRSDFSVVNVFENSHSAKPLVYKITGVWGNHDYGLCRDPYPDIRERFGPEVMAYFASATERAPKRKAPGVILTRR